MLFRADVVIAGGGLAAQRCCEALRRLGYDRRLLVACEENHVPYDRPALSKQLLTGERDADSLSFRPSQWYADNAVELLLGTAARDLDTAARTMFLDGSKQVRFRKLVLATGSRPRRLPVFAANERAHVLRTRPDAQALRRTLQDARGQLAVIGAGLIGMEVASSANLLGVKVTLVEAARAPLARALPPALGGWLAELHRSRGVDVRLATTVRAATQRARAVELKLSDGTLVAADAVLVATGMIPAAQWLAGRGLGDFAILTDAVGRTRHADIYAAGDVACCVDARTGECRLSQHWEAAARAGEAAARSILGLTPLPCPPPMFWSDQHGHRIHVVGDAPANCAVELEADPDGGGFTAWLSDRGVPRGAVLVDRPGCLARTRARIAAARTLMDERQIAA